VVDELRDAIDLVGAVDLHVHGAPDVVARRYTDLQLAERAKAAGMRAVVLKSHHESTVGRAALVREATGFQTYGGLVLNTFTAGGLEPDVVEASLALGARIVWLPTLSATNHVAAFGATPLEWADPQRPAAQMPARAAKYELDPDEDLPRLERICQLVARYDATLASGHVDERVIYIVGRLAATAGARFLVTHPDYLVPGLTVEAQQELSRELASAFFERCAYLVSPAMSTPVAFVRIVDAINATGGSARNVLSSDLGQLRSAAYPDGLLSFAASLVAAGLGASHVARMLTATPSALLAA
jgi:hypothetical protein